MSTLDNWIAVASAELGVDPAAVDVRLILDLARDVAHQVDRPAAPVTAFLLGLAASAGIPANDAAARLDRLAAAWAADRAADDSAHQG